MKKKALILCALALVLVFVASSVLASNRIAEPTATPDGELNKLTKQTADPDDRLLDHKIVGGDASEKQLPEFTEVDISDSISIYPLLGGCYFGSCAIEFFAPSDSASVGDRRVVLSSNDIGFITNLGSDEGNMIGPGLSWDVRNTYESEWTGKTLICTCAEPVFDSSNYAYYPQVSDEATIRVLIYEGDGVVGYAMIHLWDISSSSNAYCFNGSIRKAVMFEHEGETVALTMDQANALIDEAERELIDGIDFSKLSGTAEDDVYNH